MDDAILRICVKISNFEIITTPEDYALITALYRSSIDGRRFMYEAIVSDNDNTYNLPSSFTSRTSEILQVYLKSLGVRIKTVIDDSEFIGEPEHDDKIICYHIRNNMIFCTPNEMYYLNKLSKVYKNYVKETKSTILNIDDAWDYCLENLPFKRKCLTDNIINLFKNNLEAFTN